MEERKVPRQGKNLGRKAQVYYLLSTRTKNYRHIRSSGGLSGAVVAHSGAVVAHRYATPDCETAALGSNPAISPAYIGLPVLRWAAVCDGTSV